MEETEAIPHNHCNKDEPRVFVNTINNRSSNNDFISWFEFNLVIVDCLWKGMIWWCIAVCRVRSWGRTVYQKSNDRRHCSSSCYWRHCLFTRVKISQPFLGSKFLFLVTQVIWFSEFNGFHSDAAIPAITLIMGGNLLRGKNLPKRIYSTVF